MNIIKKRLMYGKQFDKIKCHTKKKKKNNFVRFCQQFELGQ